MKTMNIALPDGLKEYVQARVSGGGYSSASEFIRELIREDQQARSHSTQEVPAVVRSRPDAHRHNGWFRNVEMEFRYKNAARFAELYRGQWLAIEGEDVIAASLDLAEVVAAARQRGIKSPYVVQIDTRSPEMPRMGV